MITIVFLLLLPIVVADTLKVTINDPDGTPLSGLYADIVLSKEGFTQKESTYLDSMGSFSLTVDPGTYLLTVEARDASNDMDYFYVSKQVSSTDTLTVTAVPVAVIRGIVLDNYDNLVVGAALNFQCSSPVEGDFPYVTDNVGSFRVNNVRLGKCRVFASSGSSVGFVDLDLQNKLHQVELRIDKRTTSKNNVFLWLILVFLAGIVVWFFFFRKKPKAAVKGSKEEGIMLTSRMKDLLKTFNENENSVVKFMLEQGVPVSQAKIRASTGIPKTSLFRCIQSLEKKNIVVSSSVGKLKNVEFTDFFLSGRQPEKPKL